MEVIIIFGLIFAVIGALINDHKNRSSIWGGVVGFLFGIFGVVALAIWPKNQ